MPDWARPTSHRKTHKNNTTGGRTLGANNRLIKPCPNCGARRYEKCYQMRTVYVQPREYYPFYIETLHKERIASGTDESLVSITGEGE